MMKLGFCVVVALTLGACARQFHQFDVAQPSRVAETPPPSPDAVGHSHEPYRGKPKYLAEARPMVPTRSAPKTGADNPCNVRSARCDERLRAVLASIDGQILALSNPPTPVELQALRLQLIQLTPLLSPYPDVAAERQELGDVVEKLPTLTPI
ncbi:MAG: hypothetical protein LC659_05685, partial [Myxococcales bacterium]|nr:hypothetical protein [Myxococcales bacterium]